MDDTIRTICSNHSNDYPKAELLKKAIREGHDLDKFTYHIWGSIPYLEEKDLIDIHFLLKERNHSFEKNIVIPLVLKDYFEFLTILFETKEYHINQLYEYGRNALFYLVKSHYKQFEFIGIFNRAMQAGIDTTLISESGENLFHAHARGGQPDFYFDKLIKLGLDINKKDNEGLTPLHIACNNRNTDGLIEKMVANGANLKIRTGNTWGDEDDELTDINSFNAFELRMRYLNSWCDKESERYAMDKQKYIDLLLPKK